MDLEWLWERVGGEELEAVSSLEGFPGGSVGKESTYNAGDMGSIPGLGRSPGGGHEPTSLFLPGKSPGTGEPGGLQSMGCKGSDTEQLSTYWK